MDSPPVADLLARAADGDQRAWDEIVARHARLVWAVARAHRLERGLAEDVFQTVWLRLVENLDRIRQPDRLRAWLVTTARRESLQAIRRSAQEVPGLTVDDLDAGAVADEPVARLLVEERDAALWRAFGGLSERCQALLRLLTADPAVPYAEVSRMLDMPIGAIGPTRGRCLERLREALDRQGAGTTEST